jgi:hypothetical protein
MTLLEIGTRNGSDKPGGVFRWYDGMFTPFRERGAVSILEIGIKSGKSLRTWRDWFGSSASRIVGLDINPKDFYGDDKGFTRLVADQSSRESLSSALGSQDFDIIIDDGSHMLTHQQISLGHLFPRVRPGGLYIIEDLHVCQIGNKYSEPFQKGCPPCEYTDYMLLEILRGNRFISTTMTPEENKYFAANIEDIAMHQCKFHKGGYARKWGMSEQACIWKKQQEAT